MSGPLSEQKKDDGGSTSRGHGGARPKVKGHRDPHLSTVNGCRVKDFSSRNDILTTDIVDAWDNSKQSQATQKCSCEKRGSECGTKCDVGTECDRIHDVTTLENGVSSVGEMKNSHSELNVRDVTGERTLNGRGSCCKSKSGRHEHHFSYPHLQWAFGGVSDSMQGRLHEEPFEPHHKPCRNHCDDFYASPRTVCSKNPKGYICKSQSLMLTKTPDILKKPTSSQVNHISLYDETDERLALERWRNAGLALRRVLTSKAVSKHKGDSHVGPQEGEKVQISPECQNVVDEIFEDVDDDTVKNVCSSSTCSTSESPEVYSMSEQGADSIAELPRQRCESLPSSGSRDCGGGIWDSQLYPMSGQFQLSPEQGETDTSSEGRASGENGLFPWRHGATLLGACLFPQCMGIIGGRRHIGTWGKGEGGDMCNDQRYTECNTDSKKLNCDMNFGSGNSAIINVNSQTEHARQDSNHSYPENNVKPNGSNRAKHHRLSWNTEEDKFVFDSEDSVTLPADEEKPSLVPQSGSQCTSSFHSEDSHGDATKSSGYNGDKGGDSDVSSVCDGSGDIYFYEDSDKFDTMPRRERRRDKSSSPFKKTLQREKKKKLVHARKTHKRKSSSSSSDVMVEENSADAQDSTDITQPFQSVYEPCPSFIACSGLNNYDQGQITPPRRSVSIARHFLDRGRSRDRVPVGSNGGLFRTRDVTSSDISPLPRFDISPLSRLPSFLESLQNSPPPEYLTPELDQPENLSKSLHADPTDRLDEVSVVQGDLTITKGDNSGDLPEKKTQDELNIENTGAENGLNNEESKNRILLQDNEDEKSNDVDNVARTDNSVLKADSGGNSLLSPDSWIRLIDEIYQPIVCESDAGEESALSDTETEKAENKTPDFFRCLDTTDKSSDSGDADDEFECECDHCQLLRSLDRPSRFLPTITTTGETRDETGESGETTQRGDPWETDWAHNAEDSFDINLEDLRPLEPFLLSLQDLPQDPVDLMFQNVITQMLAVHPELLGEQAPPPVSQNVIDSLPAITATDDNVDDDLTCPVCLCHFEVGEAMTRLPCQHRYHPLCIKAWLAKSGTCPVCRHSLHRKSQSQDENDL